MSECNCASVDRLAAEYVDGDLDASERQRVESHLGACPPCHSRIAAEQAVRRVLTEQKPHLQSCCASDQLHARCRALAPGRTTHWWRANLTPLALAATLTIIVGSAFLYQLTVYSSRVMVAELAADHMKCFAMNQLLGTHHEQAAVESALASGFGWDAKLPAGQNREGLALVGARPCFYGEGRIAHVMYQHNGRPVSLFMLPRSQRADEVISVFGHEATIWSVSDRTFVLVAREEESEFQRLASFVRSSLH